MDLSTTSTSASAICHQCFTMSFLRDVTVDLKASLQSSAKRSLKVSMMASRLVPVRLGFHWILWSRVGEVIVIRDFNGFRLLQCHVAVLELT